MAIDDTEESKEEAKQESPPPKKGNLKLIIIIAAAVLIGGGAAAYLLFLRPPPEAEVTDITPPDGGEEPGGAEPDGGKEGDSEQVPPPVKVEEGVVFPLEHFIVNVKDEAGEIRYLKIEIKFELTNAAMQPEIENKTPKIRDSIVTILTNKSVGEISDTSGKMRLKEEIKARLNSFMTLGKIKEVYFTDFIIQ